MKTLCSLGITILTLFLCGCADVPLTEAQNDAPAQYSPDPMGHIPQPNVRSDGVPINY